MEVKSLDQVISAYLCALPQAPCAIIGRSKAWLICVALIASGSLSVGSVFAQVVHVPKPAFTHPVVNPHPHPVITDIGKLERAEWRRVVMTQPVPKRGCYKLSFPDTAWEATRCSPTRHIPYGRHVGGKPYQVGNDYTSDFSAQVVSGTISLAIGAFDSVSSGISEHGTDKNGGQMGQNVYSLQLNSNTFTTPLCAGALAGAPCAGWEQFIFSNHGPMTRLLIQYWLVAYNTACPANWMESDSLLENGTTERDCFMDADTGGVEIPPVNVADLTEVSMAGSGAPGNDGAVLIIGPDAYTVSGTDPFGLEQVWFAAEYNIFGDADGSQATFDSNATIEVRTAVQTAAPLQTPSCLQASFTGETNNLSLSGSPEVIPTDILPSIAFTETNGAVAAAGCASNSAVSGNTLQWVSGDKFVDWAKDTAGLNHYTIGSAMCVVHAPGCGVVGHNGKDHFFPKDASLPAGVSVVGVAYMPFWPSNIHKTDRGSLGSAGSYGIDADLRIQKSAPLFTVHWQNACQPTASGDYTGDWSTLNDTYQVSFLISVPTGTFVDGAVPFTSIAGPVCADSDKPPPGVAPQSNTFPQSGTYPVVLSALAPSNGGFLPWYATFPPPGVTGQTPISSWTVQSIYNPNAFDVFLLDSGQGHTSDNCFQSSAGQLVQSNKSLTNLTALYGNNHPPLYLIACTKGTLPKGVTLTVNYTY
jgi:hypothetical protein